MNEKHWIFADGACSGNPGPGGWGAILITCDGQVTELGGGEASTTNNRMELSAVIEALNTLRDTPGALRVFTDSIYVIKGITAWVYGWQRNGWKTSEGTDVSNRDLWVKLLNAVLNRKAFGEISWEYVRGHIGIPGNERCDEIAVAYSKREPVSLFEGAETQYPVQIRKIPNDTSVPASNGSQPAQKAEVGYPIYLSLVGRVVEKHKTWGECEARVKGTSGAKFKKVLSQAEEQSILKGWGV